MSLGSLDLVEDQVRSGVDSVNEVLEYGQVGGLVPGHVLGREYQPRMARGPSFEMAIDTLRLYDRARDVVVEQTAWSLTRRRDAPPRLARRRREPRLPTA